MNEQLKISKDIMRETNINICLAIKSELEDGIHSAVTKLGISRDVAMFFEEKSVIDCKKLAEDFTEKGILLINQNLISIHLKNPQNQKQDILAQSVFKSHTSSPQNVA